MEVVKEEMKIAIQWQSLIEMIIVLTTILGSTIPLFMHTDSKLDEYRKNSESDRKEMVLLMHSIQDEMKDFHYRLLKIEEGRK